MQYVLVQTDLAAPTPEQFRGAFRVVKGYTDADANRIAREAYGVLMRNLTFDNATLLQQAMTAQGVPTAVIPATEVPRLPEPKATRRVEFSPQGLLVYDQIGRSSLTPWAHVAVVAAGQVSKVDIVKFETTENRIVIGGPGHIQMQTVKATGHKIQSNSQRLLHILTDDNPVRIEIDMDAFQYKYALPQASPNPELHFGELVRELAKYTGRTCFNRGAVQLKNGELYPLPYANKASFSDECTWLMWMATRPEAAG